MHLHLHSTCLFMMILPAFMLIYCYAAELPATDGLFASALRMPISPRAGGGVPVPCCVTLLLQLANTLRLGQHTDHRPQNLIALVTSGRLR